MTDVAPENENELFDAIIGGGAARLGRGRDGSTRPVSPAPARDRASKPETATAASLASETNLEAPNQASATKRNSSTPKSTKRQAGATSKADGSELGSPLREGSRYLDIYISGAMKQALLDAEPATHRTSAIYMSIETCGKKVIADHPAPKLGTMFSQPPRTHRASGTVTDPKRIRIILPDEAAATIGKLVVQSSLSSSAFIEECLTRWIAAGKPQPGA